MTKLQEELDKKCTELSTKHSMMRGAIIAQTFFLKKDIEHIKTVKKIYKEVMVNKFTDILNSLEEITDKYK